METRLLQGLAQLLDLTPEQQQRLQGVFENIEATAGDLTVAPAASARLRVHLRPSTALAADVAARRRPGAAGQPFAPLLDRLSPRLRAKLQETEPRLLTPA